MSKQGTDDTGLAQFDRLTWRCCALCGGDSEPHKTVCEHCSAELWDEHDTE